MPKSQPEIISGEGGKISEDVDFVVDVVVVDSDFVECFCAAATEEPAEAATLSL